MELIGIVMFFGVFAFLTVVNVVIGNVVDEKYRAIVEAAPKIDEACAKIMKFKEEFPGHLQKVAGPIVDRMIEDKLNEREGRE